MNRPDRDTINMVVRIIFVALAAFFIWKAATLGHKENIRPEIGETTYRAANERARKEIRNE